jgi:hypothetical protein
VSLEGQCMARPLKSLAVYLGLQLFADWLGDLKYHWANYLLTFFLQIPQSNVVTTPHQVSTLWPTFRFNAAAVVIHII